MSARADTVCKLILIGDGAVGKTCIINRFKDDGFSRVYAQTTGLDLFEKRITLRGDKRINLGIWDIGGQNLSRSMLGKYIYGSQVVFLCYDITNKESFKNLTDWLNVVKKTIADAVQAGLRKPPMVFVAGNKIDLEHLREVSLAAHEKFISDNRLKGGFFMSAQSGENVVKVFTRAAASYMGIELSAQDLAFTERVLAVSIVDTDDSARTRIADEIEKEDMQYMGNKEDRFADDEPKKCCAIM